MATPKYTHLSQRNQILKRPGQHIGSTKNTLRPTFVSIQEHINGETIERIVEQELTINQGLVHIFYEVLSNAQDNYFRSLNSNHPLKKIDITIDQETGLVSVWNDGLWIPNVIHKWTSDEEVIDKDPHYEAEIIFGHLNSSSNYDDIETARTGGGLHGVGVKLTNIFSSEFTVECFDPETGLRFNMTWTDNMNKPGRPKITKLKQKKGYTRVSYIADFKKFGVSGYDTDHINVMKKMCIDCAMITGRQIIFNGTIIPVKNIIEYAGCYTDTDVKAKKMEFKSEDSMVVLTEKSSLDGSVGFNQISFVNGICTNKGGVHIDEWKKAIFKPLLEKIKNKLSPKNRNSSPFKLSLKQLEQYFVLFVNCNLKNPEFIGQTKETLSSPIPTVNVPISKLNSLLTWDFMFDLEETFRVQNMKELSKTDGKKTASISIPKADDANKAGTARSSDCVLFITEGDSAKAFAVKGIGTIKNGTDFYGVIPVRGKVLNVRGASAKQINENKEITNLKKILGLQHGVDYSDEKAFKSLRYGQVRILSDADEDGNHIKGLIINFFQYFFPSLIERRYISSIRTPIVKATLGKQTINFYYLRDFKEWAEKQSGKFTAKYYKGLGTSTDIEIREIFKNPRQVQFIEDSKTASTVAMIFDKNKTHERKKWLENYIEKEFIYEHYESQELVPVSDFFNNEMIQFSIYDNKRSIPSVVDGLKPSQRKALWVGLHTLTGEYKLAQFAAEVAKQSEYHHGEKSLEEAIIGLAQTFVGSNNITLLAEKGQFGSRNAGGNDAAAARYIFTNLTCVARYILRKEDDPILDYLEDEGKSIEPRFFVPVAPLLLINGCEGIGTGYSTFIPAYNPLELVEWIRGWLKNRENSNEENFGMTLKPWYWNFKGVIEPAESSKNDEGKRFNVMGVVEPISDRVYEITELPIGVWTDDYKEHLNSLCNKLSATTPKEKTPSVAELKAELAKRKLPVSGTKQVLLDRLKKDGVKTPKRGGNGGLLSKWEWHGDAYNVKFKIWTREDTITIRELKLIRTICTTNMTAFTPTGGIKKYDTVNDILHTFCLVRFEYYQKRKKYLLHVLKEKLQEIQTKAKFIEAVLQDHTILKQTEADLFSWLKKREYWSKSDSYRYLTDMPVRTFTADKYQELLAKIKETLAEIDYVQRKTPTQMWLTELDDFCGAYEKWKKAVYASRG